MRVLKSILLLLCGGALFAQRVPNVHLYPCPEGGLWGYRDVAGRAVIPAQFPSARRFHEGLAAARKDARYGYIDSTGAWAIAPQFDGALDFCNGLAKVLRDGKANFVDHQGNLLFDEWYFDVLQGRNPDLFVYYEKELSCGLINRQGKKLGPSGFCCRFGRSGTRRRWRCGWRRRWWCRNLSVCAGCRWHRWRWSWCRRH